jgi:hypothetical protein
MYIIIIWYFYGLHNSCSQNIKNKHENLSLNWQVEVLDQGSQDHD